MQAECEIRRPAHAPNLHYRQPNRWMHLDITGTQSPRCSRASKTVPTQLSRAVAMRGGDAMVLKRMPCHDMNRVLYVIYNQRGELPQNDNNQ